MAGHPGKEDWDGWTQKAGLRKKPVGASQNIGMYQVGGGEAHFVHVSAKAGGSAAAAGQLVGVSRDVLVREEKSQYGPGQGEPLERRLDASRVETRPIRNNGTPGGGLGIEVDIAESQYHFMPHCTCPSCDRPQVLDPFGALLKPVIKELPNGDKEEVYLSDSGRPIDWFRHDEAEPIKTAYFGCKDCEGVLTNEARAIAWYQCINTGIKLRAYLESLPDDVPADRQTAGIEITPLLRLERQNTAANIIRKGVTTTDVADFCQQLLGKASSVSTHGIALSYIKSAIGAAVPDRQPDLVVAGIDQGRSSGDHVWIQNVWFPDFWGTLSIAEVKEAAIRQCVLYKATPRNQIPQLFENYNVDFGCIDNEPDIPNASALAKELPMVIVDQKGPNVKKQVEEKSVSSGGLPYECWHVRDPDFKNDVLCSFTMRGYDGAQRMRLTEDWEQAVITLSNEESPARHLTAMVKDPETSQWVRPDDHKDGAFYAAMFAEIAITIWLEKDRDGSKPFRNITLKEATAEESFQWGID